MKRLLIALVLALTASSAFAQDVWPRTFFFSAGFGTFFSTGDMNERVLSLKDTTGRKQKIHSPDLGIFASPDFTFGVNVREFTIDFNFQLSNSEQTINGFDDESEKGESLIWRISMEFFYNIFWPEDFQIGVGASYSYATITTDNTAFIDGEASPSEFMGSSLGLVANVKYFIFGNLAIVPYVRLYENWYRNVYTEASGLCDLDSYMWQTFFFVGAHLQLQF